jgi:hypothetical protein
MRRWLLALCVPLLSSAAVGTLHAAKNAPAAATKSVSFPTQARLGNIFLADEKVQVAAAVAAGDTVAWSVTDYHGVKVADGKAPVAEGKVVIEPGRMGLGSYLMHLTASAGQAVRGQGTTSFAVIAGADPSTMADTPFGVMTHFAQSMSLDVLPLLTKAGITHARDELPWAAVEPAAGKFDFTVRDKGLLRYMEELRKSQITPLTVLAFGNKFHFDVPGIPNYAAAPHTPEQYQAYARYCQECLKQFGPQLKTFEIWNEYNGSFCKGPAAADRPRHYTAMLKEAYTAIKALRPDIKVLGGATVRVPLPYCEKLFKLDALKHMDAMAIHPYRTAPEGVERRVSELVALMKQYNQGRAKPIWVTECGTWLDKTPERAGSASYLVRMYTLLLTQAEVERIFWYLACDYREFTIQGLVHSPVDPMGKFTPTTSYAAYANLIQQLHHARFKERVASDPRTRVYHFQRDKQNIWVCWSTAGTAKLTLLAKDTVQRVDLVGGSQELPPIQGRVDVAVGQEPFYLVAPVAAGTSLTESARADRVIADSVLDFSGKQGQDGWTYGYYASNKDGSAPYRPEKVQPMTWEATRGDWAYGWQGPANWLGIGEGNCGPSAKTGSQMWAVRRWTSSVAGPVHIVGNVSRGGQGDGVACKLFLDGKEIYAKHLAPNSSDTIDVAPTLQKGSHVDLVVTPGPGLDTNFDTTSTHLTILMPLTK